MGVRNLEKGEAARKEILASEKCDQSSIEVWPLDMDSYDSVKAFASRANNLPRLDAVLANAGVMTTIFSVTEDNEKTITTKCKTFGTIARIVIPNSGLHYMAPLRELDVDEGEIFARINNQTTADMCSRYPVSKLLVTYIVRELAERLKTAHAPLVVINTPNPSYCKLQLVRDPGISTSMWAKIGETLFAPTTEAGSRALVHGSLSGSESNGHYMTNCHVQTPASSVTCGKGPQIQKRVFRELVEKLEKVSPGVASKFDF